MKKYIFSAVKKKKYFLKTVCWIVVILYMTAIFYFSSQNATQSDQVSMGILAEIRHHINLPTEIEEERFIKSLNYNHILRKTTHFIEYFVLSMIVYMAFRICRIRPKMATLFAFTFCIIYASLDEYHQSFVLGRSPALRDIIIDVSGGALALIIIFFIRSVKFRMRRVN